MRRCSHNDAANTTIPPRASSTPTQPVDVQPSPPAMATPPSHAPSALAVLNAEWLSAAASVCAYLHR